VLYLLWLSPTSVELRDDKKIIDLQHKQIKKQSHCWPCDFVLQENMFYSFEFQQVHKMFLNNRQA